MSRCIAARSFGIAATMTRSAASFLNKVAATWLIAWREVRSLMPISTLPLPIGITSPPSRVARPWSWRRIAPPDVDLAGEVRVELVDRGREDGFLVPGRPVQRVQRDAAVDPAGRVPRVQRVRQRRQQILGDAGRVLHQLEHLAAMGFRELLGGQPADQGFGEITG